MQKQRRKNWLPIAITIATTLAFFVLLYFAAYLALGTRSSGVPMDYQVYQHQWQASLFRPASQAESFIRQKDVDTAYVVE
jgi:hypothetical protein